jgi:hypothetical protein
MRVLRSGTTGPDVELWEHFLAGRGLFSGVIDGRFDPALKSAVMAYQSASGLNPDGIVGANTWGAAMLEGLDPTADDSYEEDSANWPPPPSFGPLSPAEREATFGRFSFVPDPTPGNPEGIRITDGWYGRYVVNVLIPQLEKVQYAPKGLRVTFHEKAADQLISLFKAWEDAGLSDKILTWGGSYSARFVRGSRTSLSNHSFASAFDINVQWNMLGARPALKGQEGCVRDLVGIANDHGFFWGGHFKTVSPSTGRPRLDGMHFEVAKIL